MPPAQTTSFLIDSGDNAEVLLLWLYMLRLFSGGAVTHCGRWVLGLRGIEREREYTTVQGLRRCAVGQVVREAVSEAGLEGRCTVGVTARGAGARRRQGRPHRCGAGERQEGARPGL